jgi:alkylhydroperoxidase family enzyme
MARVPYLQKSDLPPEHQDILERPIALNRAMANSPNAARAMTGLASYIRYGSRLDPRLRELAILQVGYVAKSPYEWSHHVKIGREFGVSDDDIRAIADETAGRQSRLDATAANVLRAAREMTRDLAMTDDTFAALEKALGREAVIDLTLAIAFYSGVVRLIGTLQIDVEPEYQLYLEQHPLPR